MDSWTGWSFTFRLIISFLIWKRIINFKKFSVAFCKTKYNETTDILRYMHFGNFTDMKWISAAYRNFNSGVKPEVRKMRLWENKKDKSIGTDSPSDIGI
jgi:hypothetical protein